MRALPRLGLLIPLIALSACKSPPDAPTVKLPAKYRCLAAPSAAYMAGSIIRNLAGQAVDAATVAPDALTVAYLPPGPATYSGNFPDIEQSVASGLNAALTAKKLEKFGITLNLKGDATYDIQMSAKTNTTYISDDDALFAVSNKLREREGLIQGARYFFVKEAMGSQELSYSAKNKATVAANAKLTADSSGLAANVNLRDAKNTISSKKELIACVVLEEIELKVVKAASGATILTTTKKPNQDAERAAQIVSESITIRN